ncbi:methionyl-tRNA formyltransferase, partial [Paenibacillus glucanolyticus]
IQRSIINGEAVTGITLMYMAEGLDTGDMLAKAEVPIEETDTAGTMFEKLSQAGAKLLQQELPRLVKGKVDAEPQDEAKATYAPNLTRDDEKIDWSRSSREIYNQIRGLVPYSGGFTLWNGEVFKVWAAANPSSAQVVSSEAQPGTVLGLHEEGIVVKTGDGSLTLLTVQPSGKKAMDAAQFVRGTSLAVGTVLT